MRDIIHILMVLVLISSVISVPLSSVEDADSTLPVDSPNKGFVIEESNDASSDDTYDDNDNDLYDYESEEYNNDDDDDDDDDDDEKIDDNNLPPNENLSLYEGYGHDDDTPTPRKKRALVFRPLFAYRKQQIKKQRLNAARPSSVPANHAPTYNAPGSSAAYQQYNPYYYPYQYAQRNPYRSA